MLRAVSRLRPRVEKLVDDEDPGESGEVEQGETESELRLCWCEREEKFNHLQSEDLTPLTSTLYLSTNLDSNCGYSLSKDIHSLITWNCKVHIGKFIFNISQVGKKFLKYILKFLKYINF